MLGAGQRNHRVRFERRPATADDGFGNVQGPFACIAEVWAGMRPQFGGEQLKAGQLNSSMRGVVTVLRSRQTAAVTPSDRLVFVRGPYCGKVCNILSITPSPDASEIEMMVEETGA